MLKSLLARKIVFAFLLLGLILQPNNLSFAVGSEGKTYSDLTGNHPFYSAISYLSEQKVLEGYMDGTFRPDQTINRAELLKIMIAGQGLSPDPKIHNKCFTDIGEEWFAKYICYARSREWIGGYPDGQFRPAQAVNKAEALKILINTNKIEVQTEDEEAWYQPYNDKAEEWQLIFDQNLNEDHLMTRAEIADSIVRTIVARLYDTAFSPENFAQFKLDVQSISQLPALDRKALIIAPSNNFDDREYFTIKKLIKESGYFVQTASSIKGNIVSSAGNKTYSSIAIEDIIADYYDAIIYIGGKGISEFEGDKRYDNAAIYALADKSVIGSIGEATRYLAPSGLFFGITVTGWDDDSKETKKVVEDYDGNFSGKDLEIAGKIISAKGSEQTEIFTQKIIEELKKNPVDLE